MSISCCIHPLQQLASWYSVILLPDRFCHKLKTHLFHQSFLYRPNCPHIDYALVDFVMTSAIYMLKIMILAYSIIVCYPDLVSIKENLNGLLFDVVEQSVFVFCFRCFWRQSNCFLPRSIQTPAEDISIRPQFWLTFTNFSLVIIL